MTRSLASLFVVVAFAGACARTTNSPKDFSMGSDLAVGGGDDMGAGDDLAQPGGDGGGACTHLTTWPTNHTVAGYDPNNMVTLIEADDGTTPPFNALLIEDYHAMGATYPKMVTFSTSDTFAKCDVCVVIAPCDAMGCTEKYFAQGGTATVTRADQNATVGRMTVTASNVTLVEWDFSQMGDKAVPGGGCYQIDSLSFDVPWNRATDGGTTPDMARPSDAGTTPPTDLGACRPVINELQATGVKASDEWIEIYNPCSTPIPLANWFISYSPASGSNPSTLVTLTGSVPATGYYLIANSTGYSGTPTPDVTYSAGGLAGTGGAIALVDPAGAIVDAVAYQSATSTNPYCETSPAPNPPAKQSIARHPNGADNNNNSTDFQIATTPTPKAANP